MPTRVVLQMGATINVCVCVYAWRVCPLSGNVSSGSGHGWGRGRAKQKPRASAGCRAGERGEESQPRKSCLSLYNQSGQCAISRRRLPLSEGLYLLLVIVIIRVIVSPTPLPATGQVAGRHRRVCSGRPRHAGGRRRRRAGGPARADWPAARCRPAWRGLPPSKAWRGAPPFPLTRVVHPGAGVLLAVLLFLLLLLLLHTARQRVGGHAQRAC